MLLFVWAKPPSLSSYWYCENSWREVGVGVGVDVSWFQGWHWHWTNSSIYYFELFGICDTYLDSPSSPTYYILSYNDGTRPTVLYGIFDKLSSFFSDRMALALDELLHLHLHLLFRTFGIWWHTISFTYLDRPSSPTTSYLRTDHGYTWSVILLFYRSKSHFCQ